jgi:uncharacterized protein YdeI (YjbR/CyaY-like superfamily)
MTEEIRVEVRSVRELEDWLAAAPAEGPVWLVTWKSHHPDHVSFGDLVESLIAYGWIDSRTRRLDDDRTLFRVTPRKPGSMWSRVNKEKVAKLQQEGRMTDRGQAAVDRARADGSWSLLDDVDALVEPPDLTAALERSPEARATWEGYPPSLKKQCLWWLKSAKRDVTRERRMGAIIEAAAEGRRPIG